ncbi:preprotein translocase subunit SecA [Nitratiruptor sp. YY08-26]|uniref:preprotein translocase subunit SecA n=1 Tax=unclassified Nitratiruptor TaxID=2624044 RepID=UPI0019152F30|nr:MULTISPECIES: preprotein translocase subunit SecA [unclassified Nitratiruptor]BCD62182.1 preprotein translocase subunit SecA [Nitratiruptor sp. YY08-13]BCD66118.1 preprotein translocase subunit SecA [Nitratiruptor sp. YY08-26]
MLKSVVHKIIGTKNDRELKRYQKRVKKINALEPKYEKLSDEELKKAFDELRQKVKNGEATMDEVLEDSFAITREASKRVLGMRHFDVQLIGGMVLHEGKIAEMKTGEGKTLVATLAVALNAMTGEGVHVVTVNDYLAKRDATEMGKLYEFLGYSTGCITSEIQDDLERKKQYQCDITYGTNNEFGFDYLRDNMKYSLEEIVQRGHNYAIVDEVDSILIDEARTPLIISGPTNRKLDTYIKADKIAKQLERDKHFTVDEKDRVILLTQEGIAKAEELFGVDNLYSMENAILAHHLDQALKANHLFQKDVDYVVKNGEVVIVDEFTGRLSEGRRFSEGLHQALEAKEGVQIQEESQTLADITFQNYFRLYKKLAGMTGTAQTEATEFAEIYGLEVISIPTNRPVIRKDLDDLIFKTEKEKFDAVVKKIKELHKKGQPVLVGTTSIEKNELLHKLLTKEKIPHTILNAKHHEKEAEIIAQAGKKGAVTVATNMAGRGVDIKIDDEVRELGGLFILGTERHESRRIDNQLRGRAGRQGDPGASQFFLSLEDNLLRIFGGDRIKNIMNRLGIEEGEHIESKMVTRAVEKAQKKVENLHFESRKHILEYDDVANEQRKTIYKFRQELLNPEYDIDSKIKENRAEIVEDILHECEIFPEMPKEDFNLEKLVKKIQEDFNTTFSQEELQNRDYEDLKEYILQKLENEYEEKMSRLDDAQRREIERILYLQVLDNAWREHLYQMDILKTGIGLRGYNQKDPLVEYKKESYNLFIELIHRIKSEAIKTLHMIQLRDEAEEEELRRLEAELAKMEEEVKQAAVLQHGQEVQQEESSHKTLVGTKKPARNEPCPCGSGKKYKHCCGKSGPKKGVLAAAANG